MLIFSIHTPFISFYHFPDTCSLQVDVQQAWWQVDLQEQYEIVAVLVYDTSGE